MELAPDEEELDNLAYINKKVKMHSGTRPREQEEMEWDKESMEGRRKKSYRDLVLHSQGDIRMGGSDSETDDEFSNDDNVEQDEDGPWI